MLAVMPPHRPHEQVDAAKIDQRRGDRRDQEREQQESNEKRSIALRSGASSSDDLDEVAAHGRRPDDAHHVVVGAEERLEGIDDGAVPGHVAHVDVVIDRRAAYR